MIAVLLGCAALNSGVDLAASTEYRVAEAVGLGPAFCGAVVLGSDLRTLVDLRALWGPAAALWAPVGVALMAHLAGALMGVPGLGAWSSPVVAALVWVLRRTHGEID